jgi:hypothetical protein
MAIVFAVNCRKRDLNRVFSSNQNTVAPKYPIKIAACGILFWYLGAVVDQTISQPPPLANQCATEEKLVIVSVTVWQELRHIIDTAAKQRGMGI